jgi:Fe2+ transport system protein FeoA
MRALKRANPRGIPLSDLRVGESARVVSMDLDEETAWKFMEMGFGVGRRLRLVRRAPLGDPMELELLGYHLAVRSEDVEGILVHPLKGA